VPDLTPVVGFNFYAWKNSFVGVANPKVGTAPCWYSAAARPPDSTSFLNVLFRSLLFFQLDGGSVRASATSSSSASPFYNMDWEGASHVNTLCPTLHQWSVSIFMRGRTLLLGWPTLRWARHRVGTVLPLALPTVHQLAPNA
jgi:hypothetical protein